MLREKIHYLDVRRRPSQSNTFATLPPSLRGSMAYLSSVENRKNLLFIVNFALLVCSLILIGETLKRQRLSLVGRFIVQSAIKNQRVGSKKVFGCPRIVGFYCRSPYAIKNQHRAGSLWQKIAGVATL